MKRKVIWPVLASSIVAIVVLLSMATTMPVAGKTIVVTSTADSGPGTLREVLLGLVGGENITFDSTIFPPSAPAIINLESRLPDISQGYVTVDASNAGVILDGSNLSEGFVDGLHLTSSDNTIRGLQFLNFRPGAGISLSHGAQNNIIGGDRGIGTGPLGQGNLMSYGDIGVNVYGEGISFNTIMGNLIGTDPTGGEDWGNSGAGIEIDNGASHNIIGPDNIIAYNDHYGINMARESIDFNWSIGNTITGNSIHNNGLGGIYLLGDSNNKLAAPSILEFDLATGTVTGTACVNCTIEVFSDDGGQGEVYEGQTKVDVSGTFTFNKSGSFTGPYLTVTATDVDGSTSQLSAPTLISTAPVVGKTIVVTSTADNGSGTLRQALENAQRGDTITFDPTTFPPSTPATIHLRNSLPDINQGELTIDASNSGVILDGSNISEDWAPALTIISNRNTVQGLQFTNFSPGVGMRLGDGAQYNTIGGDRSIGSGPIGQGNLVNQGDMGINLWGEGISFNTIVGNLIGTDTTGRNDRGNNGTGIEIGDGASHNIIGPDNIIAYNDNFGINMARESIDLNWSIGNTITGNSIHSNGLGGINLWGDSNNRSEPPTILDFNLATGTLTGATSAGYVIEIFSDSNLQGEVYEGRTEADANGVFTFNKSASFAGPYLTATATDVEGNTSQFSAPTFGESKSIVFQEGNGSPRLQIRPKISSELVDNRLGHLGGMDVHSDSSVEDWIYKMTTDMGYKWIRTGYSFFNWPDVPITRQEINPYQDKAITALADDGIEIILILEFADEKMAGEPYWCFKEEEQIQGFLDHVQFIVHHFKDRVQYYEIFSEPDLVSFGKPFIEAADYIDLVRRTVPVIRQEYPEAKIVVPCVSSIWQKDVWKYLFEVLESDVMPLVDVITWHNGGPSPEYKADYYYDYQSIVQEIKDTASEHGFKGEYFAEELIWLTPDEPHEPHVYAEYGEISSAKYYGRGIVMNLGMDFTYIGAGPVTEHYDEVPYATRVVRNLGTIMAGAEPISLPLEIQSKAGSGLGCQLACSHAENIKYYCFSLPNDDQLVALWVDGKAVDDYPGIEITVTIPSFSAQKVMGIDVLNGFKQELITNIEEGNLVIRNLLVKDYPIILKLSS